MSYYVAVGGTKPRLRTQAEKDARPKVVSAPMTDPALLAAHTAARVNAARIIDHSGGKIAVVRDVTPEAIAAGTAVVDPGHPMHPNNRSFLDSIPGGIYTVGGGAALIVLLVVLKKRKKGASVAPKVPA